MPARNCARRPLALHNRYMQRGGAADALQPQCLRAGAAGPTLRPPPNAREVITLGPRVTDSRDTDIRISYLETQGMRVRMCVRVFSVRSTLKSMRDSRDCLFTKFRRFYAAAGWRTRPALACVRGTRAHGLCATVAVAGTAGSHVRAAAGGLRVRVHLCLARTRSPLA